MTFDWYAEEIKVTYGDQKFSIYPRAGVAKTRLVQGLASRTPGMMWLRIENGAGHVMVPVPNPELVNFAGCGESEGRIQTAAMLIASTYERRKNGQNYNLAIGTVDRMTEVIEFEFVTRTENEQADGTVPEGQQNTGAFRENF